MSFLQILASGLWGLALLVSFLGFGRLLAAALSVRERVHMGLEIFWGFGLCVALGGWLCLLGLATAPTGVVLVLLGVAGALLPRRRPRVDWSEPPGVEVRIGLGVACVVLLGITFAIGLLDRRYQAPDDHGAYFFHAWKILETGTLLEPFSYRRLASYGGQSFLHAWLMVVAPFAHLNLLDKGVARVALGLALVAAAVVGRGGSLLAGGIVLYAVAAFPDMALNSSSVFTGVLAFVGLWATLEWCRDEDLSPVARGVATGLMVAAVVPLRQNYGLACALVVALEHGRRLATRRERAQIAELAVAVGVGAVALGGYAWLQMRSGATPLFPLIPGHGNPEWGAIAAESSAAFTRALRHFASFPLVLAPGLLLLLAPWLRNGAEPARLWPLALGCALASVGHAFLLAHVTPGDFARYTAAFSLGAALWVWMRAAAMLSGVRSRADLRDPRLAAAVACLVGLIWLLPPTTRLDERVAALDRSLERSGRAMGDPERARRHARLQQAAPAGARLLVMVDHPYLFDLARNDVVSLDLPGGASPPPGLHHTDTAAEAVGYFRTQGHDWLAVVRPSRSRHLYRRKSWADHAAGVPAPWLHDPANVAAWIPMGRTVTHFFDQLDGILEHCPHAYDDGRLVMLDLVGCDFAPH
ncbi:MAG: hypothetical protein QNK05_08510 [Myxococcota bacterium]|nr:hypothetical protein [Myxococcota bacterium]